MFPMMPRLLLHLQGRYETTVKKPPHIVMQNAVAGDLFAKPPA